LGVRAPPFHGVHVPQADGRLASPPIIPWMSTVFAIAGTPGMPQPGLQRAPNQPNPGHAKVASGSNQLHSG